MSTSDRRVEDEILIVDDDPVIATLLRRISARQDRNVTVVHTGEDAVEELRKRPVALVLLDLRLPAMSGQDVLEHIRKHSPQTAVIVISAQDDAETAVTAIRAGADDYLTKPVQLHRVEQVIGTVLENRKLKLASSLASAAHSLAKAEDPDVLAVRIAEAAQQTTQSRQAVLFRVTGGRCVPLHRTKDPHDGVIDRAAQRALGTGKPAMLPASGPERLAIGLAWPIQTDGAFGAIIAVGRKSGPYLTEEQERLGVVALEAGLAFDRLRIQARLETELHNLSQAQTKLAASERLRGVGQLATGFAHELQNPLHAVQSHVRAAQVGLAAGESREVNERLDLALDGIRRLQSAIADLSLVGRTRGDAEIDLGRLVALAWRTAGATGDLHISEALCQATIRGNVGQLAHAISHIIRNALQAASAVPEGKVAITAELQGEMAMLQVSDTGPGMTSSELAQARQPFYTTRDGAAGLGLSTTREILGAAGGRLTLHSVPGQGTVVTLGLPLAAQASAIFALGDGDTIEEAPTVDTASVGSLLPPLTLDDGDFETLI